MTDFNRQTRVLREWVHNGAVATDDLAVELLAWTEFVVHGVSLLDRAKVMRRAADLLDDIAAS